MSLILGPVFFREAVTTPRRPRHFLVRSLYVTALLLLMCTAWLVVAGTQLIRNVGDMARFGAVLFQVLAPLQLALMIFFSALGSASAVSQEKDRRTLILLLLTRLSNKELVLGKLFASLLNVLVMLAAALPLFMLATLFGGVSFVQVARVYGVTIATVLAAGSLGSTVALSREKTFQTLAMTTLVLMLWIGVWEGVYLGGGDTEFLGVTGESLAVAFSPLRAILEAAKPTVGDGSGWTQQSLVNAYIAISLGITVALNGLAIWRVRQWNPSREVRGSPVPQEGSIWGGIADERGAAEHADAHSPRQPALDPEAARAEHVDAAREGRETAETSRTVWDNPVLWREVCTWAYGRKVLVIRAVYVVLFIFAAVSLHLTLPSASATTLVYEETQAEFIPAAARPLAPLFFVSVVLVNALAVTSITNERDGQALDLLLVTEITPKEFIFGKIGGVMWVTREMVVLPLLLCGYLAWRGGVSLEYLAYLLAGLALMFLFAATLGVHCGITYANSRSAIAASLGTVFFLFLGVVTCMAMMISFSGRFQQQLAPFLAFILGGGVGLFVCLGHRNPSQAIALASLSLPFATFFAITSFLLRNHELSVFLVTVLAYGFTTLAMLMPAIGEFDIAMGRTRLAADED